MTKFFEVCLKHLDTALADVEDMMISSFLAGVRLHCAAGDAFHWHNIHVPTHILTKISALLILAIAGLLFSSYTFAASEQVLWNFGGGG